MADEPTSLLLEFVERIDRRLENVETVVISTRERMHSIEEQVALLRRDMVRVDHRLDGFDQRLQRIERRLDLTEASSDRRSDRFPTGSGGGAGNSVQARSSRNPGIR